MISLKKNEVEAPAETTTEVDEVTVQEEQVTITTTTVEMVPTTETRTDVTTHEEDLIDVTAVIEDEVTIETIEAIPDPIRADETEEETK